MLRHKRVRIGVIGALAILLLNGACTSQDPPMPALRIPSISPTLDPTLSPTRASSTTVLYIGNSLTFFNELPEMFARLASSGGYDVDVAMSAWGGSTLSAHISSQMTQGMIDQREWDYVVLQEESDIPTIVELRKEQMYPAIRTLEEKIGENGGITILFMTWGRRGGLPGDGYQDYLAMQAQVHDGYMEIANELELRVAPVGMAWQEGILLDQQLDLWQSDGIHPSEVQRSTWYCPAHLPNLQPGPDRNYRLRIRKCQMLYSRHP